MPRNDPSLLFTSAGMVPFKNVFTGAEKRDYFRATTSQKCLRAGGKHNDLENVGYTARHHTFFEMLGNFSFGDYFKERAIELAWNLVTKEFGLPEDRLWITVYVDDTEAAELWHKVAGVKKDRILRISGSDNFWAMGDTGPCGPCSEIFYDHGEHVPGGLPGTPEEDGDRFVEIWNLVFMQYEQVTKDKRVDLPKPSVDTGMGLERIAAVLQGVHNNYDIDLFKGLIEASEEISGVKAEGEALTSHRVIADHLRATSFLIADGVTPSNEGRGYVLRRIMRRAMRHAYLLGCKEPLIYRLVPALVHEMGEAYGELGRAQTLIEETLRLEEERFRETLGRGIRLLEDETGKLGASEDFPGETAFKLYDTYGFPLDLTQDILRSKGRKVALKDFDAAMDRQKAEARAAWKGSGETSTEAIWFDLYQELKATEFLGYRVTEAEGTIQALLVDGKTVESVKAGQDFSLVTNQTPFYAESGGQMGDTGVLTSSGGGEIRVTDTLKRAGHLTVHLCTLVKGALSVGENLHMLVDGNRRRLLRSNHSATHLLHSTLRHLLGDQVIQKGSLVAPDRLRFDYSYTKPLTDTQIQEIEDEVNDLIRRNTATQTHLMTPDEALKTGAIALFGEKYGEQVRVVSMGERDADVHSVEFCGGTHVERTGDIGYFKIISETGIASGVRRIEALTGPDAEGYMRAEGARVSKMSTLLKAKPEEVIPRVEQLLSERRKLEREIKDLQKKLASGETSTGETQVIKGVSFTHRVLKDVSPRDLKSIVDDLKSQVGSGIVAVGAENEGRASLVVGVTSDLTSQYSAVDLVRVGAEALGGKGGGGRPDMAQAGGPDASNMPAAFESMAKTIEG